MNGHPTSRSCFFTALLVSPGGEPRLVSYEEAVDDLRKLLKEFGPYRKMHYPSYPFVKLCNDSGFWEIQGCRDLNTTRDWTDRDLIENNTSGGFTAEVYNLLKKDNNLVEELASLILNQYFPRTLHEDILAQVGLDLESGTQKVRSPEFRNKVLRAYEYCCAVCGFNVRLGDTLVAIEAAHIKWHQYGDQILKTMVLLSVLCTISFLTKVFYSRQISCFSSGRGSTWYLRF